MDIFSFTFTAQVIECNHSYDKRCHTTYVTNYEAQQEEDCEENFQKTCFIHYEQVALRTVVFDGWIKYFLSGCIQ